MRSSVSGWPPATAPGKQGADQHDAEHVVEIGRLLDDERRMEIATNEQITDCAAADCRKQREYECAPKIVVSLLGAHEAGIGEECCANHEQDEEQFVPVTDR